MKNAIMAKGGVWWGGGEPLSFKGIRKGLRRNDTKNETQGRHRAVVVVEGI